MHGDGGHFSMTPVSGLRNERQSAEQKVLTDGPDD